MLLAGLDIGTTGCKITVYHPEGEFLGRVYKDYPLVRTDSVHEVDAGLIWDAVTEVISEAAVKWPDISSIGITSFGETFVLLDEHDNPLLKSMLYTDPRGEEECKRLCTIMDKKEIAFITGLNPHPMYSISKLMWLKSHQPDVFGKTKRICLMGDYIVYMLTGIAEIDYSLATRTMAFDIRNLCWNTKVLNASGIDIALFSKPVPTGTAVGPVTPALAERLGIKPTTLICCAGHDQVAAAIGSGVFTEGMAVDGAGTVECITPVFTGIPDNDILTAGHYSIVPHIIQGKYICYAFLYTGGAVIKWFTDNMAGYAVALAEKMGTSLYQYLEGIAPPDEPTGLLVLPHFAGAATPYMDYGSKGAVLGLTLNTSQQDFFLAIMEGVGYEMRLNMEILKKAGVVINSLQATGGGANSRVWMQIKADILNIPITALQSAEAGGTGAAMMAGVAADVFSDIYVAADKMISGRETFFPRPEVNAFYNQVYEKYEKLYTAVRPLV